MATVDSRGIDSPLTENPLRENDSSDVFQAADALLNFQNSSKKGKVLEFQFTPSEMQPGNQSSHMVIDEDLSNPLSQHTNDLQNAQSPLKRNLQYDESLKGECKIIIENSSPNKSAKDLNRLTYAKILNAKYKDCIVDVKSSGFGKLSVFTKTARAANFILNDRSYLKSKNLKAFIPSYFVSSQGVIRSVPLDISEQELKDNLEVLGFHHNNSAILEVRRLSRKTINDETKKPEYVPSQTVLLTFNSKSLPSKVAIYNTSINVDPYTPPVKMCWNCLRYGHISKYCKSCPSA